ncbi:MAG: hypothetical protein ACRD8Z_29160 [Nitrososphaeraceae archaeon]
MNTKYMFIVAAMAVMLIGATALASEDAFATKKKGGYEKSQATAQDNYCGNGELPMNIGCQNTASQIQGDDNAVFSETEQEFGDD